MTDIRRYYSPNSVVFITAVCHQRRLTLKPAIEKERLLAVMREVKDEIAFSMLAYVILDDHFHCIIKPKAGCSFSRIMQSIKLRFTCRYKCHHEIDGKHTLWQRRFWDHVIRDENDLQHHLDYIHYNPLKHGYVTEIKEYPWSSFKEHVNRGNYPSDWARLEMPPHLQDMALE